jgi:hypothetical protein
MEFTKEQAEKKALALMRRHVPPSWMYRDGAAGWKGEGKLTPKGRKMLDALVTELTACWWFGRQMKLDEHRKGGQ